LKLTLFYEYKKKLQQKQLIISLVTICWLGLIFTFQVIRVESNSLPTLQAHSLPSSLAKWKDSNQQGDYFNLIKTTPVGYLIWSQFPITVYIEKPTTIRDDSAKQIRFQQWLNAVKSAIKEWDSYLPIKEIDQAELADITIFKASAEREIQLNSKTGLYDIPRAITAQTNYQFYVRKKSQILAQKMTIQISSELGELATLAAARHEIGHALGIWGHSDRKTDALYFSQVRNTPTISVRDINTLQKIYQQPTKLGWAIKN
jgi:predicted Zn-dependent protease